MPASEHDADLNGNVRVLLDSSALIAYHAPAEPVHPLAVHLLRRIESDSLHGYYSVISASQLLIRPIRAGTAEFTCMHALSNI